MFRYRCGLLFLLALIATPAASLATDAPILIDKFLDNATEVDVDCLADYAPEGSGVRVQGSEKRDDKKNEF